MRASEHDVALPDSETRRGRPRSADEADAARVIGGGRPDVLTPSAVLHLQRAAGNSGVGQLLSENDEQSPVKDVVGSGGGQPLDVPTRQLMESRLGHDFGDVRVHTDGPATESAKAVQAHAYTVGNDVVFQGDRYSPTTPTGQRMIAHELTHVVQQRSGPVDGTPAAGGIRVSDPSDRFEQEAERSADLAMDQAPSTSAGDTAQASAVQRQEGGSEEEEEVQGSFVQRQEESPEEEEEAPPA